MLVLCAQRRASARSKTRVEISAKFEDYRAGKLFTGWVDVDLSPRGRREMEHAAHLMLERGCRVDTVYTSVLKRAVRPAERTRSAGFAVALERTTSWLRRGLREDDGSRHRRGRDVDIPRGRVEDRLVRRQDANARMPTLPKSSTMVLVVDRIVRRSIRLNARRGPQTGERATSSSFRRSRRR